MCACVCVCVCARARARARVCVCVMIAAWLCPMCVSVEQGCTQPDGGAIQDPGLTLKRPTSSLCRLLPVDSALVGTGLQRPTAN